jgi:hypothetical protein
MTKLQEEKRLINCKLNNKYKEALKASKKFIKKKTVTVPNPWGATPYRQTTIWYKDKINLGRWPTYSNFRRLSCCGIDEGMFGSLMSLWISSKVWHKDFDAFVAWWLNNKGRTRQDKRIFITGLPVKVKRSSGYNATFYKKLRATLLSWGCQELTKTPYKNLNSRNYLSVLVGQF